MGSAAVTPHPAAGNRPDDTVAPYRLKIVTRCKLANMRLVPGQVIHIARGRLAVAVWLVRNGTAHPLDEQTALDVRLHMALDAALPK